MHRSNRIVAGTDTQRISEKLPPYIPRKFKRIHVELTNKCNFSCAFCPDAVMTRERDSMPEELARSALDQIAELELAEKVTFHVMGEPLLHPRLFSILDHARERGLAVGLTTNGALLTPATIAKIAESDLHQIDVSLQSPDARSFAATRGSRIDFLDYQERLLDLLAACAARPSPPILKVRIMTTRFARKVRHKLAIPDFMGSSQELRDTVMDWSERIYRRLGLDEKALDTVRRRVRKVRIHAWNVLEIGPRIFIETYVLTDWGNAFVRDSVIEAHHGHCFGMRDHFAVLCSGDVVLCCVDYDGRTALGNLNQSSLLDILKSPELERIMAGFSKGRLEHPYCKRCLGSSSRIGSWVKPIVSVLALKVLKPLFYRQYRLYE